MARLTYEERKALPSSEFALPTVRKLPIPDVEHGRNALARLSQKRTRLSPRQRSYARKRILRRFPNIDKGKRHRLEA